MDGILKLTAELAVRQADLEEQTSEQERAALATAVAEARARLDRAELAQDRRLFERQLEVLEGREEAIAKAMRVLERLRVRRELVEHQLKQLRLDLSRGAPAASTFPSCPRGSSSSATRWTPRRKSQRSAPSALDSGVTL